jgi:hypothetical protein
MPAKYSTAPDEVIDIANELIEAYHPGLADAYIGFLMRLDEVKRKGMVVLGQASKVTPAHRMFMHYHFIIWISAPNYVSLTELQRRALIDHELCHCEYDGTKETNQASILPHDIEEFDVILRRYGFWRPGGKRTENMIQKRFAVEAAAGKVSAIDPFLDMPDVDDGEFQGKDINDQINELFDDDDDSHSDE